MCVDSCLGLEFYSTEQCVCFYDNVMCFYDYVFEEQLEIGNGATSRNSFIAQEYCSYLGFCFSL